MTLVDLWLAIVLSGVAVFFASFLMWMVLPHHRGDWRKLPDEDALMDTLRSQGVGGGQFAFPHCADPQLMKDAAFQKRLAAGPSGMLIVRPPGPLQMGRSMTTSLVLDLVVSIVTAYVATIGLDAAAARVDVFRLTATVAFAAYSLALAWGPVWYSRTWGSTLREMLDGLVYGLITGGLFLAFWPAVA